MTYWSRTSLISAGVGTWVMLSTTSRSSSSARISLQSVMHSLQMYTDGPEMNFRTESFDFPQNEQRRCLSLDMAVNPRACAGWRTPESWTGPGAGSSGRHRGGGGGLELGLEDGVDDPVRPGLIRAHVPVAVHVLLDLLDRLAGVPGVELVHLGAQVEDLPGLDLDVRRGALGAARRLVDHDPRV